MGAARFIAAISVASFWFSVALSTNSWTQTQLGKS